MDIVKQIQEKLGNENTLLYLIKSGSFLYGTNSEKSDVDYIGIFKPSLNSCVLNVASKNINITTGDDNSKNTNDDVDITLWSLQYWFSMVKSGNTQPLDLFFSYTNPDAVLYDSIGLGNFCKENKLNCFNAKEAKSFVSYCINQANVYSMKGERLTVLKNIVESFSKKDFYFNVDFNTGVLSDIMAQILYSFGNDKYCYQTEVNNSDGLFIVGKKHSGNIAISEFIERITSHYEKYGVRAHKAANADGVDFKAMSHACRVLDEYYELITTGEIKFPCVNAAWLKDIKYGNGGGIDFITNKILEKLELIENYLEYGNGPESSYKSDIVEQFILDAYGV